MFSARLTGLRNSSRRSGTCAHFAASTPLSHSFPAKVLWRAVLDPEHAA